jgi:hypothetical protein
VIFIKMEMVHPLKFRSKLNRMLCQHQSHCDTRSIINFLFLFFKKELKIIFLKKKMLRWLRSHLGVVFGRPPPLKTLIFVLGFSLFFTFLWCWTYIDNLNCWVSLI